MIRTVIRLAITVAALNAVARAGLVAWDYYRLKDEAERLIVFGAGASIDDLHARILVRAAELGVPLEPANLDVQREGNRTFVSATYTQPVELLPGVRYPADLSFEVDSFAVQPAH